MEILLIDDSSTMRRIQKNVLIQMGYAGEKITEAEDGIDAFKKLKEKEFVMDLVLCDWNMPNMDGLTFVKKMQTFEQLKKIPIIMVTTESEKSRIVEAIKSGAKSYVVKPFTPDLLKERISQVMEA